MDFAKLELRKKGGVERQALINGLLKEHGLRPLRSLGDNSEGQPEIIDVDTVLNLNAKFFTDLFFVVRAPNGAEYKHMVRFNANGAMSDGAIFIPVINGRPVVVKQFRTSLGISTWEFPRGFCDKVDTIAKSHGDPRTLNLSDLPKVVGRELGEEVVRSARVLSLVALGQVAENTGTNNVLVDSYLIDISVDEAVLGGSEKLALQLLTWSDVERGEVVEINDLHSLGVIALARRHRLRLKTS